MSKVAELQSLIDAAVKNFGRLDIMVNNAGVETRTSVLDTTEEQYDKVLAINLRSAFFGTQLAARGNSKRPSAFSYGLFQLRPAELVIRSVLAFQVGR